jgi:tetratricopeptide (TPR) repeat protein
MPQGSHKYKAFISYSHQDKKWGDWLHKSLETYSIPKALIGKKTLYGEVPKRLFPVFRDRDELPTATELGTVIDKALNDSSHLVVICSPRSAKSQWVNEEIKQFKRLGKADRILCLIVDGEPYGADKPEMGLEECFPEAVKYELDEDGELSEERTEPIAADAREGKDEKRNALLKLVAGLLGVGFDELKQRDAVRRQRRMMMVAGVSGVLALVMGALAIWAWDQRNEAVASRQAETQQRKVAETQRQEAVKQKGIAEEKRKEAETELQKATVVSEFVGGIFTAVKPGELENVSDEDKDLMKLVLEKGAEKIKELEGQPEVEASIRKILGSAYRSLAFYDEGLVHHERALALRLKLFGPDHPSVATSYSNIGLTYDSKGEYDKALEYYQKSLAIRLKKLGPDHPSVATSYNNIGNVYDYKGEYDQSLELHRKSLAIRLKQLRPDHPSVASSYNNIGSVYNNKGEYDQALEYYQKSLAIMLKKLGSDHPKVAGSYNNIGSVYVDKREYDQALEYYQKSLAIRLKQLGPDHPDVAISYNNIGSVYQDKGEYDKALEYYQKSLAIILEKLGSDHPNVANSYNNIGNVYDKKDEHDQALEYYQKSLAIRLKTLGPDHPSVGTSYNNIGSVYNKKGEYDQALEYFQKSLAIILKKLGSDHPKAAGSYNNIGLTYQSKRDYDQALEYLQKGLAIQLMKLGPDHPSVAISYNNIGSVYQRTGEHDQALECYLKGAEQGAVMCQAMAGRLYAMNPKLKNPIEAIKWYTIAQSNGFSRKMTIKDALTKQMTPEQIAKAKALAQEMIKKNPKLIRKKSLPVGVL